ncbi:PAS domain-containing protein [Altererythrobacter sp.]|uniref:PAS domain-containing protein n=1 Tax=Altererythrobacter sp. TaxID=1872480 RepID=UPI003D07DF2B
MTLTRLESLDDVAFIATDPRLPDNPIVDCNDSFLKLTGYERDEVIGHNCRLLAGPGTDPEKRRQLREAIADEQPIMVKLLNYKKDGTPFMNAVMVVPIYGDDRELIGYLGSQLDVSSSSDISLEERTAKARKAMARLSPRQAQVLNGLVDGKLIKQLAYDLDLSERTIKMHRAAMLKSIGASNNAEAIRIAVEAGL